MKLNLKRLTAGLLAAGMLMTTAACAKSPSSTATSKGNTGSTPASTAEKGDVGISADSPYAGKGLDLSKPEKIVIYAIGDRPADMDKVLAELNTKYMQPWINTTVDVQFLGWSEYKTKYSLLLSGSDPVDIMYTSAWCYYSTEAGKGAFKELSKEFLEKNMPISYPQQPEASWDQVSIHDKIFAVPRAATNFSGYHLAAVREDVMKKIGVTDIKSWAEYKDFLIKAAADKGSGIAANGSTATRDEFFLLYMQMQGITSIAQGFDYAYKHNNSPKAVKADDIYYLYTSDEYKDRCVEMAELAAKGVWSSNAINDTNASRAAFENGTTATINWNDTVFDAGKALEAAKLGTYKVFNITPECAPPFGVDYSGDTFAITSSSKNPERAALVLDCMKGFTEVNNLVEGGIEGVHYILNADGTRSTTAESGNYGWDGWAWGIRRQDAPTEDTTDPRESAALKALQDKAFVPETAGFTFDKAPVDTELAVINAIRDEYKVSFQLGVYGDQTVAKFEEFKGKLEAAGLDKVSAELIKQYKEYCAKKGYTV